MRKPRWSMLAWAMLVPAALSAQPASPPIDDTLLPYASTADSVVLPDGRRLHLVCMGEGLPVVVFTAGRDGWSGAWSKVQPAVARMTRTCAWDRAGYGLSDGMTAKPTVATATADLEAALKVRAGQGPYVMVGQSMGAYETLLFADRNRDTVAGMVLVDPSPPDMAARAQRLRDRYDFHPPEPAPGAGPPPFDLIWRACAGEVRSGALKAGGPDPHGCLAFLGPPMPPAVAAAVAANLIASPAPFETIAAFHADAVADAQALLVNPARNYGDIPLIVLTATANQPEGSAGQPRAFVEAVLADSNRAHDEMAALSTRGINRRVPGTDHNVQDEKPQAVIDAIKAVVREARRLADGGLREGSQDRRATAEVSR